MKKFKFKIDDENFDVSVNEKDNNIAEVIVNGKSYTVQVEREEAPVIKTIQPPAPKAAPVTTPSPTSSAAPVKKQQGGAGAVKSPLPGNIFKVVVDVGQSVKKGDLLVVIESMKMENNILSDREGCVKVVHVQPGQSILQNDLLIELE